MMRPLVRSKKSTFASLSMAALIGIATFFCVYLYLNAKLPSWPDDIVTRFIYGSGACLAFWGSIASFINVGTMFRKSLSVAFFAVIVTGGWMSTREQVRRAGSQSSQVDIATRAAAQDKARYAEDVSDLKKEVDTINNTIKIVANSSADPSRWNAVFSKIDDVSSRISAVPALPKTSLLEDSKAMKRDLCTFSEQWTQDRLDIDYSLRRNAQRDRSDPNTLEQDIGFEQKRLDIGKIKIYRETFRDRAIVLRGKLLTESPASAQTSPEYDIKEMGLNDWDLPFSHLNMQRICMDFSGLIDAYEKKINDLPASRMSR